VKRVLLYFLTFSIGIIPAFFIVYNSVFSDSSGGISERLFSFLLVILVYGVLGFIFGRFIKEKPIMMGILLSLPSIIILLLYLIKEPGIASLLVLYLVLTVVASCIGFTYGIRR
jgi:hypothetical protein